MKGTGIIIRKELKRVFSDRKLVFSLFILPAILVVAIYGLMGVLIGNMESDITEHIPTVYIVDKNDSLDSVLKLTEYEKVADVTYLNGSEYSNMKSEMEDKLLNGQIELIVALDSDFESKLSAYAKAGDAIPEIKVFYNSAENYSTQAYSVFNVMVLDSYRNTLLASRLGNLEMLTVFNQDTQVIVKEEKANTEFISMMLPYLITMMLFAGAMSVGVDAIAGEKERGTLSSMLITPVKRQEIVVGKLVSMAILSGLSAIVYSVSMIAAIPLMGSGMGDELANSGFGGVAFNFVQCVELLLIMLIMVYLFVALIGFLAVLAKDTKTAQTYISPCYIIVILASMVTMFSSGKDIPVQKYMIPVYGNALAIKDLIGNELTTVNFLASLGGTVLVAAILTAGITWAFNNEKVMFNS